MTLAFGEVISLLVITLIICSAYRLTRHPTPSSRSRKLLVSLGSGGHTTEMLLMLKSIDITQFSRRDYYISSGDSLSYQKAVSFESSISGDTAGEGPKRGGGEYQVRVIARARRVKQSWWSTPVTALISFIQCLRRVTVDQPDLMICNGPGTCVMLVIAVLILRYCRIKYCRIIFIESFARVQELSLSGKLLIRLVDRFLVMWPELADKYEKAEYAGMLL